MKVLLAFLSIFAVVILFLDGVTGKMLLPQLQTQSWPKTDGVLLKSERVENKDNDTPTYTVDVEYQYSVNGRLYKGTRFRYGMGASSDSWAQDWVKQHPSSSQVEVFYELAHPENAVLAKGLTGFDLFLLLFFVPFHGAILTGFSYAASVLYRHRRWKQTAGHPLEALPGGYRVRMSPRSPITVFWGAWTVGAFLLSMGQAFLGGMHISWERGLTLHCLAILVGIAMAFRASLKSNRDLTDLRITREGLTYYEMPWLDKLLADPGARPSIPELLRNMKGSLQTLSWDQIQGFPVEHEARQGEEGSDRWVLTVLSQRQHVLKSFPDERTAATLSQWLSQQRMAQ